MDQDQNKNTTTEETSVAGETLQGASEPTLSAPSPDTPEAAPKKENAFMAFLARKDIVFSGKRYGIDALGAMALGLFGSLLIGTIFKALGLIPFLSIFATIGGYAQAMAGAAMAVAIAHALKAPPFVMFTAAAVGHMANTVGGAGGPVAVLLIAIVAVECGKAVSKETKVDIIVTPFVTLLVGGLLSAAVAPLIGTLVGYLATFIGWATLQQPFVMGIIVSAVIGVALTLPISSAAICASLGLSAVTAAGTLAVNYEGLALAGGAAVAGCCAHMVGFAFMSYRENGVGGLVSQGIGTSMIQMPNLVKHPLLWIPPVLTSLVTGPLATCLFKMQMYGTAINSGMGTCGLLGPIGIILGWFGGQYPEAVGAKDWIGLVLICFVLPAVLTTVFSEIMRRMGLIQKDDLKL